MPDYTPLTDAELDCLAARAPIASALMVGAAAEIRALRAALFEAQQAGELLNDARREIAALRAQQDDMLAALKRVSIMFGAYAQAFGERGFSMVAQNMGNGKQAVDAAMARAEGRAEG